MKNFMKQLAILSCFSLTLAINCADIAYGKLDSPNKTSRGLELGTGGAAVAPETILTTQEVDAVAKANESDDKVKANVDLEAGCFDNYGPEIIACGLVATTPCVAQVAAPYAGLVGGTAGQLLGKIFLAKNHTQKFIRHATLITLALAAYGIRYYAGNALGFDYMFTGGGAMSLYFHAVDTWEARNRRQSH